MVRPRDTLLTIKQAAAFLRVSEQTLRRWDASGRLRAARHPHNNYRVYARAAVLAVREQLVAAAAAAATDPPAASRPSSPPPGPLVVPAAEVRSFVGRARELAAFDAALDGGAAVLTVVGPPGVGKTRFARAGLARRAACYPGGAVFCDLSQARTLDELCAATAHALRVAPGRGRAPDAALEQLGTSLAARGRALVVLDNVEQIVDAACAAATRWGALAPEVALVFTSRERLRVPGETVLELGPLGPTPGAAADARDDALELFLARARAAGAADAAAAARPEDLAAIVARLEGMPLAIELAAARLGLLGARELRARLARSFDVLAQAPRGAARRHATLDAAIAWSWRLLAAEEQVALAACAVFRDGFALDAAEHVLSPLVRGGPRGVLATLAALCEKSLLHAAPCPGGAPGERRFAMLLSVREFAAGQLATEQRGVAAGAWARHAAYYLDRGAARAEALESDADERALAWLWVERANLRQIAEGEPGDAGASARAPEQRVRAVLALHPMMLVREPGAHHVALLDAGVALAQSPRGAARVPVALHAALRAARAVAWRYVGRLEACRAEAEDAIALARAARDRRLEGRVVAGLAVAFGQQARTAEAYACAQRALALHRATGDARYERVSLLTAGWLAMERGRLEPARRFFERASRLARATGDAWSDALATACFGRLAFLEEQPDAARRLLARAAAAFARLGDQRYESLALGWHADADHARWDLDAALARYRAALACAGEQETRSRGILIALMGVVLADLGQHDAAAAALERAEPIVRAVGDPALLRAWAIRRAHLALWRDATAPDAPTREAVRAQLRDAADDVRQAARMYLRAARARDDAARAAADAAALRVREDGGAFRAPGAPAAVALRARPTLARLLAALVAQRARAPGVPLSTDALFAAGWPGQRARPESRARRVQVAIATLRGSGLRDVLVTLDDGYALDAAVELRVARDAP